MKEEDVSSQKVTFSIQLNLLVGGLLCDLNLV